MGKDIVMPFPQLDSLKKGKISPPPIHEEIIKNGKPSQALIRYLLDLRRSTFNAYDEVNSLIEFVNNIQAGAGLDDDGNYTHREGSSYLDLSETLYQDSTILDAIIKAVTVGAGLAKDGEYTQSTISNYINSAISLNNADLILDSAIWDYTREAVSTVTADASLLAHSQTVLCNATGGAINITMPNPSDCFENNRSLRFAIHKIDTSSNAVNILPNGTETMVGEASQSLLLDGEIYNFITDGNNWYLGA